MTIAALVVSVVVVLAWAIGHGRADQALPLLPDPRDRRWRQDSLVTRQCLHRLMSHGDHPVWHCGPVEVWVGCHVEVNGRVIKGSKAYSKAVGAAQERDALLRLNGVDPE